MFVASDEGGSAATRAALFVAYMDRVREQYAVADVAHAPAQIEILAMQEIGFVETAHSIEGCARQEQACTGNGIDRFDIDSRTAFGHRYAGQGRMARLETRKTGQCHQRPAQRGIAATHRPFGISVGVLDMHSDHADMSMSCSKLAQARDGIDLDEAVRIEEQQGIAARNGRATVAGRPESDVFGIAQQA